MQDEDLLDIRPPDVFLSAADPVGIEHSSRIGISGVAEGFTAIQRTAVGLAVAVVLLGRHVLASGPVE